jgi:hypothetical protein
MNVLSLERDELAKVLGVGTEAARTRRESFHGLGVSALNGPPGPNLRSQNASTPARMSGKCGGVNAVNTPSRPVELGSDHRSSSS